MKSLFNYIYLILLPLMVSFYIPVANAGSCSAVGGERTYASNIDAKNLTPSNNYQGRRVDDFFEWSQSNNYHMDCDCTGLNSDPSEILTYYFSAKSPLTLGHTDGKDTFYKINDSLEVSTNISIDTLSGQIYFNVPFNLQSDNIKEPSKTLCKGVEGNTTAAFNFSSGGTGNISLYIAHPFVGTSIIPLTTIATLYATLEKDSSYSGDIGNEIVNVTIQGSIVVNQSCEIPAGYAVDIPLGDYNARDFKGKVGSKPDNVKVIEKTLDFNCSNIADGIKIYLKIQGKTNANNPSAIDLNNPDVGAVVTDEHDNVLTPNSDTQVQMDVKPLYNETMRNAQVKLKAYPIGITGKMPKSGSFEGVATLDVNVE